MFYFCLFVLKIRELIETQNKKLYISGKRVVLTPSPLTERSAKITTFFGRHPNVYVKLNCNSCLASSNKYK